MLHLKAVVGHRANDLLAQRRVDELAHRQVHRKRHMYATNVEDLQRATGRLQHSRAEGHIKASVLDQIKERSRCEFAKVRMVPTSERLDTNEFAGMEIDDRLQMGHHFAATDAGSKRISQLTSLRCISPRLSGRTRGGATAFRLGLVHPQIGVGQPSIL